MMAGPLTRRSERRSTDLLTDPLDAEIKHAKEIELFSKLAEAIGDTLETVCNMQERERNELITVLGLGISGDLGDEEHDDNKKVKMSDFEGRIEEHGSNINQQVNSVDDDFKVVADRKRKRTLSGEKEVESKRKLPHQSEITDFSRFLASKDGNIFKEYDKKEENSVLIKEIHSVLKEMPENLDTEEESLSLLGQHLKPGPSKIDEDFEMLSSSPIISKNVMLSTKKKPALSLSQIQEQLDGSDDDEFLVKPVVYKNSVEIPNEDDDDSNANNSEDILEKVSEINRLVISKLNLDPLDSITLNRLVQAKDCRPNLVFSRDIFPATLDSSSLDSLVKKTSKDKSSNILSKYFQSLKNVQSTGLFHGSDANPVSWRKLLPQKNSRGKNQEKGILMKFFKEDSSEKRTVYESSDEFEDETSLVPTKIEIREPGLVQDKQEQPSLTKLVSSGFIGKSPAGVKIASNYFNRLKLPKGKRRIQLGTPEKNEETKSELVILSTSPEDSLNGGKGMKEASLRSMPDSTEHSSVTPWSRTKDVPSDPRQDAATNTSRDLSTSDDDSIEIVLEVASTPNSTQNTPVKSGEGNGQVLAGSSPALAEPENVPKSGTCPMCDRHMSTPLLVKHAEQCMGPDQGPSTRKLGGRERIKL